MSKQDLHDFADVAENYDLYLEAFGSTDADFVPFYLSLAEEYGQGGVLDIACGTGAVALPLAQAGYDVQATDLSEAMLVQTRQKLAAAGLHIPCFAANMTDLRCERRFSLAVIARSGFMHLPDPQQQRAALCSIRDCLTPGGILTLNSFEPDPRIQAVQMQTSAQDYTLRSEYTNRAGQRERIYNAIGYDPQTQLMQGNWRFDTLDTQGEPIASRVRPLTMRQTYRQELAYLLELCGFSVLAVYGDYRRGTPSGNGQLIWLAQKEGGTA